MALMGNFTQAITLLVIDYAAGFRVSAPTAIMSTITKAARHGILIRGGRHVEQLAEVDALVFDKTGTLTVGCPDVVGAVSLSPDHRPGPGHGAGCGRRELPDPPGGRGRSQGRQRARAGHPAAN